MATDRIDSIIDLAKVQAELDATKAGVKDLVALIQSVKGTSLQITEAKSVGEVNKLSKELEGLTKQTNAAAQAVITETQAFKNLAATTKSLTGTLDQNIKLQARYKIELAQISAELKSLDKLTNSAEKSSRKHREQVAELLTRQQQLKLANAEVTKSINNQIKEQNAAVGSVDQLRARYNLLITTYDSLSDAERRSLPGQALKTQAAAVETQIKSLEGSTGRFQRNVGNYTNGIVDFFKKAFGGLRTLANIIPGLGISGIILLIIDQFTNLKNILFGTNNSINVAKENFNNLNEVMKEANKTAGEEITDLKILYSTAIDVSKSTKLRQDAVDALQKQFPDYFGSLKDEAILNGDAKKTYDELTVSIIKASRAQAAKAKIDALEAERLAVAFQKAKIIGTTQAEERRVKPVSGVVVTGGGFAPTTTTVEGASEEQQREVIRRRRARALAEQEKKEAAIDAQEKFLIEFVGQENLTKAIIEDEKGRAKKVKEIKDTSAEDTLKILQNEANVRIEGFKRVFENDKNGFFLRLDALEAFIEEKNRLVELEAGFELAKSGLTAKQREVIESNKWKAQVEIAREAIDLLQKVEFSDDRIKQIQDYNAKRQAEFKKEYKEEEKLFDGLMNYIEKRVKENQDRLDKIKEEARKKQEDNDKYYAEQKVKLEKELINELINLGKTLVTAQFERQKNAIQDQIDLLEDQKQKDIEVANQTITNVQDRAAAVAVIEARAATQREQLERRQRQIQQQQAKFEKAASIANIIAKTAEAIIGFLAKPGGVQGVTLSVLAGVIGAAQLARVVATPIPKYAEGTDYHKGGAAIVGDGGRSEGIQLPDGSVLKSPSKSTLVDLPEGTKVFPDYNKMMLKATVTAMPVYQAKNTTEVLTPVLKRGFKSMEKALRAQPKINIVAERKFDIYRKTGNV